MSTININGYNINYKITGEGEKNILMLQGWGTTVEVYNSVANAVNDGYRFIQVDLPGFGQSDEPKEPWCVDDFADFVCDFLKALNVESTSLALNCVPVTQEVQET